MVVRSRNAVHPVLGRAEHALPAETPLSVLRRERVIVTGGNGGLGRALVPVLERAGVAVQTTDVDTLDVTEPGASALLRGATLVFHLAAAKDAVDGESRPEHALRVNGVGTANVLSWGIRTVFASTCKAASPETVYGASKLIGERLVLNAGGSVARFFNVYDTPGNVFETWAALAPDEPLPVSDCTRYFISSTEAVSLLLWAAVLPPGRYVFGDVVPRAMRDVASALYPSRATRIIPRRRGDREREPFCAPYETVVPNVVPGVAQLIGAHDGPAETAESAAGRDDVVPGRF